LDDHAGAALAADDGGFEPVVVDSGLFPAFLAGEDSLGGEPGFGVDEGGMGAGVFDALEGDDASVVGVGEDGVELFLADWPGWVFGGGGVVEALGRDA